MANPFDQFDEAPKNPFDQFDQGSATLPDQKIVASRSDPPTPLESFAQGAIVDPVNAGAQMLTHALPQSVVDAVNHLNNYLADKTGLVTPIPEGGVDQMIKQQEDQYASKQGGGFDTARLVGSILSPVNYAAGAGALSAIEKLRALGGVGEVIAKAVPALAGGAASVASQPITQGEYGTELGKQFALGAAGGQIGQMAGQKIADVIGSKIAGSQAAARAETALPVIKNQIESQLKSELGYVPATIDTTEIAKQAQEAMKSGKSLDVAALARQAIGEEVLGQKAGLMTGQITQDPQEWSRMFNLSQIEGVGKPIADRLKGQEKALIDSLTSTAGLVDPYDAGTIVGKSLKNLDNTLSSQVSAKYNAFRKSGGAMQPVNLAPIQQTYGNVLENYGAENIPSAVKNKIESFVTGQQNQGKVFDLLEADKLLKTINANYDPLKKPQASALNELRSSVKQSLDELANSQAAQSNNLLKDAISAAKARFELHDAIPALKAASFDKLPNQERFVQQYITSPSAGIDSVSNLVKKLDPEGLNAIQGAVVRDIVSKAAPGAEYGLETAKLSPATLRKSLNSIGQRKLDLIFGKDKAQQLRNVEYVANLVKTQPSGAVPNRSGTAGALTNLVNSRVFNLPIMNIGKESVEKSIQGAQVGSQLSSKVPESVVRLAPNQQQSLQALGTMVGVPLGSSVLNGLNQ